MHEELISKKEAHWMIGRNKYCVIGPILSHLWCRGHKDGQPAAEYNSADERRGARKVRDVLARYGSTA